MIDAPTPGIPRPLAGSVNSPKTNTGTATGASVPAKPVASSGYHSRALDDKARKDRDDKLRKLVLQRRGLELKKKDLETQEDKYAGLRREITKLENQVQSSSTIVSETVLNTQTLERQNKTEAAENEKKIRTLEQEVKKLEQKITEDKQEEEKLKRDDEKLAQDFEFKKQAAGKEQKESLGLKKQSEGHQQLLQQTTQDAKLVVNRIDGLKQEIAAIQKRIQDLQR